MKESRPDTTGASRTEDADEEALADDGGAMLEMILSAVPPPGEASAAPARIDGVVVGSLASFDAGGAPLVEIPGRDGAYPARSTVSLGAAEIGREVAVMFEGGDPARPIVMGLMHRPQPVEPVELRPALPEGSSSHHEVDVDGKRMTFTAEEEIVFRCGKASITLTRAGKILIRGAYVLTRSSGVNRILGGSVQIN